LWYYFLEIVSPHIDMPKQTKTKPQRSRPHSQKGHEKQLVLTTVHVLWHVTKISTFNCHEHMAAEKSEKYVLLVTKQSFILIKINVLFVKSQTEN